MALAVDAIFDFNEPHITLFIVVRQNDRETNDEEDEKKIIDGNSGSVCVLIQKVPCRNNYVCSERCRQSCRGLSRNEKMERKTFDSD